MKQTLLFVIFILLHAAILSQTVNYGYDNAGNRTSRRLSVSKSLLNERDSTSLEREKITEQIEDKTIIVYPNPVREEVNVEISGYDENLDGSISLFDQVGRLLINQQQISQRNTFNLSRYSRGIYFMIIKIGTNKTKYTIIKD
jgi:hypothetical protein